jgi:type IV secretion system protein VirB9
MLIAGLLAGLCVFGTAHAQARVYPLQDTTRGAVAVRPPTPPPVPDAAAIGGSPGDRHVLQAVREGQQNGGRYPVVAQGLSQRVPFGYRKPTLYCQPLRSSLIRLEPGETVWSAIPADPISWSVQLSQSGPEGITPIVVVKPLTEAAIVTNLFISTDRRIYEVLLQSGSPEADRYLASTTRSSILEFYYPDDIIRNTERAVVRQQQRAAAPRADATTSAPASLAGGIPLDRMRFTYTWKKDKHFPWAPVSVFDDGAHVYIILPQNARHEAGAVLFVRGLNGENTMLEYAVREGRIVTDRVFREAQFVYAEPSRRKKPKKVVLTIRNTAR